MILAFLFATAAAQTQPPPPRQRPVVVRDSTKPDTTQRDAARRLPVTAELVRSAFKTSETRSLFELARRTRIRQDSAIRSYDVIARQRMSVDLGIGNKGREHLFYRQEVAARVQWQHDVGAWIDLTGARVGIPMAPKKAEIEALLGDMSRMSPIPYFPGSESLWIGGESTARVDADDRGIVNPLANGAEAYYTYAIGDSVSFRLPDGKTIRLREIEVRPRAARWNLAVGSLWFDANGQLVKAAYRLSVPVDFFSVAEDEGEDIPGIVKGLITPMRAEMSGIAIEYSLHNGEFWLPKMRSMSGKAQVLFAKVPMEIDQRFEYQSVNRPLNLAKIDTTRLPPFEVARPTAARRDSIRRADSTRRASMTAEQQVAHMDSGRRRRDSVSERSRTRGDSARKAREARLDAVVDSLERGLPAVGVQLGERGAAECDSSGVRTAYLRRFAARMPVAVRIPCDLNKLIKSPDLPKSIYDPGEELFGTKQRDEMLAEALSLADQAPLSLLSLPKPSFSFGLPMTRFNRVEGFSTGIAVEQQIGAGLSVGAVARFGLADKNPNVELTAARSNLTKTIRVTGYHHLVSASDWGNPLSFGSSFSALVFGKDEGFYYRATGAEATWSRGNNSRVEWRLFGENQKTASVNTQMALVHRSSTDTFPSNIVATEGQYLGSGLRLVHNHGRDPRGFRTFTDVRLEAAKGDSLYGRGAAEMSLALGTPYKTVVGITLSGGSSVGMLPAQRRWYLGGTHTVRGQSADIAQSGNAYWLTRLELAKERPGHRSSIFGDLGWAGDRSRLSEVGRPLSGVGFGESMFDGIVRFDISRGLFPRKQWRFDLYLEAKF